MMEIEYYMVIVKYCDERNNQHSNTFLAKSTSRELILDKVKADCIKQGLPEDKIIKIDAHKAVDFT